MAAPPHHLNKHSLTCLHHPSTCTAISPTSSHLFTSSHHLYPNIISSLHIISPTYNLNIISPLYITSPSITPTQKSLHHLSPVPNIVFTSAHHSQIVTITILISSHHQLTCPPPPQHPLLFRALCYFLLLSNYLLAHIST